MHMLPAPLLEGLGRDLLTVYCDWKHQRQHAEMSQSHW